ncbi:hypothetical protein IFM89_006318 [Coptis chinensis]|uniref:Uncharacterized protein n=1 Tax=Coptis chinensis TaxID=261450 RepID=A0A835IAI9_9MAGN|nr:hypothetical protein IFM89_006318 [Coptis chinensis]
MAGLQRSTSSYRRQGSSGLVWENRFSGDLGQMKIEEIEFKEMRSCQSVGSIGLIERSRSTGGHGFRTNKVSPDMDPPSPKVMSCGLWKLFGKRTKSHRPRNGKYKS